MDKYERRGFTVIYPTNDGETPGENDHYCFISTSCPLTERRTTDGGVRYVAFTEAAALRVLTEKPDVLSKPELVWCHGGRCAQKPGQWETAKAFEREDAMATAS